MSTEPSRTEKVNFTMAQVRNDFLTLKEASKYLRISTQALYDLANSRKIPCFKVGNRWRFRKSAIDRWVEQQESGKI